MKSGIFAVVTIGPYRFYVGEVHHLQSRWRSLLTQFENGVYPHPQLQQAWYIAGKQRRFSFHTLTDLMQDQQIIGRPQFLADMGLSEEPSSPLSWPVPGQEGKGDDRQKY